MEVVEVVDVVERRFRRDGDIERVRVREAAERFGYELLGSLHSCIFSGHFRLWILFTIVFCLLCISEFDF